MKSNVRKLTIATLAVFAVSLALGSWAWADKTAGKQEHPTAPQLIESLKPKMSDEQAAVLADGVLTREEYMAARDRVVSCMEASGLTVHREPGRGPGGIDEIWAESPPSAGDLGAAVRNCYDRHQGELSMIWAEQNRPTVDDLAAHASAVASCLTSKGVVPKPLDELWENEGHRIAYFACLAQVPPPGTPH